MAHKGKSQFALPATPGKEKGQYQLPTTIKGKAKPASAAAELKEMKQEGTA